MNEENLTVNKVQELALNVNHLLWPTSMKQSYIPTSFAQASCGMSSSNQHTVPSMLTAEVTVSEMQISRYECIGTCKSSGAIWMTQASKSATTFSHNHTDIDDSIMDLKRHFDMQELNANRKYCKAIATTAAMNGKDDTAVKSVSGNNLKRKGKFEETTEVGALDKNDASHDNSLNNKMSFVVNSKQIGDSGDTHLKHPDKDLVVSNAIGHRDDTESEVNKPIRQLGKPYKKARRKTKEKILMMPACKNVGKPVFDPEVGDNSIIDPKVNGNVGLLELLVDLNDQKVNGSFGKIDLLTSPCTFDLQKIEDVLRLKFHTSDTRGKPFLNVKSAQKMILEELRQDQMDLNDPVVSGNVGHFELLSSPSMMNLQTTEDAQRQNSNVKDVGVFRTTYLSTETRLNYKNGQKHKREEYKHDHMNICYSSHDTPKDTDTDAMEVHRLNHSLTRCDNGKVMEDTDLTVNSSDARTDDIHIYADNRLHVVEELVETNQDGSDPNLYAASQIIEESPEADGEDRGQERNESSITCSDFNTQNDTADSFAHLDESQAFGDDSVFGILGVYCRSGLHCWHRQAVEED
ncbi:uncharacterized protein LOC123550356 [Mercenaria mercenaria]|uniref:uncharacterized protein LOC123550356 n=1 Tax=Mercenaria mercenaria TaxID=6596 RepID=UPI001E1D9773|nr:uncharacterized protein LOC123550356 [Mercenaria mercenaria]